MLVRHHWLLKAANAASYELGHNGVTRRACEAPRSREDWLMSNPYKSLSET